MYIFTRYYSEISDAVLVPDSLCVTYFFFPPLWEFSGFLSYQYFEISLTFSVVVVLSSVWWALSILTLMLLSAGKLLNNFFDKFLAF